MDKIGKERYRTAIGTHINIGGLTVHLSPGDMIQAERVTKIPYPATRDYEKIDYKCQSCHCTRGSNKENCHDCCVYNRLFPPTNHQPNNIKNIYTSYLKDYGKGYNEQTFLQYVACSLFNDHERQETRQETRQEVIIALRQAAVNLEQGNTVQHEDVQKGKPTELVGQNNLLHNVDRVIEINIIPTNNNEELEVLGHNTCSLFNDREHMVLEGGSPHTCYTCGCLPCACNR